MKTEKESYRCAKCGRVPDTITQWDFHLYSGLDPRMDEVFLCDECAEELWGPSGWTGKQQVEYPSD